MFVTVAFGLGVDMRDIRCIVHIGLPNTLEEILFKKLKGVAEMAPWKCNYLLLFAFDISNTKINLSQRMRGYVMSDK